MNALYGKTWGSNSPIIDYSKIDIDRQKQLEKYTDFEFSTKDKLLGTISGLKKEAIKDYDNVTNTLSSFGSSFKNGSKILIVLLVATVAINLFKGIKSWSS